MWTHRTIIVPAALAPLARALAAGIAGESGAGMWERGLSPTGDAPATHYISAGLVWPQFAALLADPAGIVAAAGGAVSLDQAQALVSASIVTTDPAEAALTAAGLQYVRATTALG